MRKNCLRLLFVILAISITGDCLAQKKDTTGLSNIFGRENRGAGTANLRSTIDCTPVTANSCNHSSNNTFSIPSGANCNTCYTIFDGDVASWLPSHGTPDVNPPWTSTVSPTGVPNANFAWMIARSNYVRQEIGGEGIAQKIPPVTPGNYYTLSFLLQKADFLGFGGWETGPMDQLNIVLMHCEDAPATFRSDYELPNIPINSQQVVCLNYIAHTSWEQYAVGFTPNDDYDMILIYPSVGYRPFQTFPNNFNPATYISAIAFAYPELMPASKFAITTELDDPNDCEITLSVKCGITNAVYTWRDPYGNVLGQGSTINVPAGRPGIYRASMTVPPSPGSSNNGCSDNNPTITAQIDLTPLNTGRLQVTKAIATYDVRPDGINVFKTGKQTTDFLSSSSCTTYNFYNICRFIDEGTITFNLSSNQSHGNVWEIYRDNELVPTRSRNTIIASPVPDNTLQDYNPQIEFIDFRSPTTFEIRLTNTILNETESLFITLRPQAILNADICATASSPAGWFATRIISYYTTPSTQYVWDMGNAPGSFQYTQPSPTDPNIVYDPGSLSGSFTASVRTVGAQYGCEHMRWATISPLLYECDGLSGRTGVIGGAKDSAGREGNPDNNKQANALLLYPNPATSIVNVTAKKNMEQINIVGMDGRRIQSIRSSGTKAMVPVTTIQKGTYLLVIKYKDGTWENKLIIKQ